MSNKDLKYAEFVPRAAAYVIDWVILFLISIPFVIIIFISGFNYIVMIISVLAISLMRFFYYTYYHGRYGATIGKKCMRIKVVDIKGNNINYITAACRIMLDIIFTVIFSTLVLLANMLMILLTKQKRAVHDYIANTLVISLAEETEESKEGNKLSSKV